MKANQKRINSNIPLSNAKVHFLPKEWSLIEFGEMVEISKNKFNPVNNINLKCLELEHINQKSGSINGWIDSTGQKSIKNRFQKGQVLFGKLRPYLEKYWLAEFDGVCSSEIWVLNSKSKKCSNDFIFRLVQTHKFIQLTNVSSGSKMPRADWDYVSSFPFPVPPIKVQYVLNHLLSNLDKSILLTERKIGQKVLLKKWLFQQLLNGKRRLKGFEERQWREVKLGDITENFSRRNKKLVDAQVYSVTNSHGFVHQDEHFSREVAGEDLSNYKIIKKGEFAYNPARINVGSIAYFENEVGLISSLYVCFKTTNQIDDYYLFQLFDLDHTKYKINAYGEGGVRIYLWYDLFAKIKVFIPEMDEQLAICKVLRAADKEIDLLRVKVSKLREYKKGLIQKLLTGKMQLDI